MSFELLHLLRLKGLTSLETISEILEAPMESPLADLEQMAAEGMVSFVETPRIRGWRLTPAGVGRHATEIARQRSPDVVHALGEAYEEFLRLNGVIKALCSSWQRLAPDDEAGRWAAIDELAERRGECGSLLERAARVLPRFDAYRRRLERALEQLGSGDARYFTGLAVDSFHNVWFECHEDFLQTLGRERAVEGSF